MPLARLPVNGERALLGQLAAGPVPEAVLARLAGLAPGQIRSQIEALREAGMQIQLLPGQGYRLLQVPEWLDHSRIRQGLSAAAEAELAGLELAWSIDSTNAGLLRCSTPLRGTQVLLAEAQTGGRGRRGRAWRSPLGANIYLSVARCFDGGMARLGGLSLVAGVAVAEALHGQGFAMVGLKWPNDLVVPGADGGLAKLGGLLVEGGGTHAGAARAVIGLGLNVAMPSTTARLIDQPWTDLAALSAAPVSRNGVVAAVLDALLPALAQFDDGGLAPFLQRWRRLDVLAGRQVDVHDGRGVQSGLARGLADDGALQVEINGRDVHLHAGEVTVRIR